VHSTSVWLSHLEPLRQWQALRARCFDDQVRRFLGRHPDGTMVALGEGRETQFWRVDNGRVRWLSVDVAETIELRDRLLPSSPRQRTLVCSALDERWMDEVDTSRGLLVTAQGLLMYFEPAEVHVFLAACARRLPETDLIFDAVPRWLSARSRQGRLKSAGGYQAPWGINAEEERRLAALHPNITELQALRLPRGRGALHGLIMPLLTRLPAMRRMTLSLFAPPSVPGPSESASGCA
jgi:O-methyltransferase involved in polyketide biosynthesis